LLGPVGEAQSMSEARALLSDMKIHHAGLHVKEERERAQSYACVACTGTGQDIKFGVLKSCRHVLCEGCHRRIWNEASMQWRNGGKGKKMPKCPICNARLSRTLESIYLS
jgi:hypothetical protein